MAFRPRNNVVEQGATVDDLSVMFAMDKRDVRTRLRDVRPTGLREGVEYWSVRTAAPFLMPIDDTNSEVIERLFKMHPNALPKILAKEFWAGQLTRLNVLAREGDLWDTEACVNLASTVFKTIRISLMLFTDALERETGLTEPQRELITGRVDALLIDLRDRLIDDLRTARDNTTGKAFASKAVAFGEEL